ncbi:MAG: metal ABC transporter substrate-binding protein [Oligoflexus sp.]
MRFSQLYPIFLLCMSCILPTKLFAKPKLVATSSDLASIAQFIGGDLIEVEGLIDGNTDLHYVSARPDFIRKVNQADIFVFVGLDLEVGWVPLLLRQSRNAKIQAGGAGYVDASQGIQALGAASGTVDRSMGDVHPQGNPHYWTDPVRVVIVARNIADALKKTDPGQAAQYDKNLAKFQDDALALGQELKEKFKAYEGRKITAYHNEFSYMAERFGFEVREHIEERPGVSPSPKHIRDLVIKLKAENVRVVVNSPWTNLSYSQRVAKELGAEHVILPIRVKSATGTDDWFAMMRQSAETLLTAFKKTQKAP